MDEDLAEAAREGLVALGVELLVAEEDHAVVEQGLADVADGGVVEILRHVDAGNLRAAGAGEQTNLETRVAHGARSAVCSAQGYHIPLPR